MGVKWYFVISICTRESAETGADIFEAIALWEKTFWFTAYLNRIEGGGTPRLRSNGGLRIADDCTFPLKIKKKNAVKLEHLDFVESARFSFGTQPHMVY